MENMVAKCTAHVTSTVGYVRLHRRNYSDCFSETADVRERYDHLSTLSELEPWVDRTGQIAEAKDTYLVSSNHNIRKAAENALETGADLSGKMVRLEFRRFCFPPTRISLNRRFPLVTPPIEYSGIMAGGLRRAAPDAGRLRRSISAILMILGSLAE